MRFLPFCILSFLPVFLFAEEATAPKIQKEILVQSEESWDGALLPKYTTEQPQISVVKFTIPPQAQLPWHKHPMINAGYVIKGELTVEAEDGSEKFLKAGDGLIELVETWHYGRNDGDGLPVEIVVVYAGIKGQPLAILKEE